MDPISLIFLNAVVCGVIGNRADATLQWLYQRLTADDPPVRTLQTAVRRAYWQSTSLLLHAYLKELGQSAHFVHKTAAKLQRLLPGKGSPSDLQWALQAEKLVAEEFGRLSTNDQSFRSRNIESLFQSLQQHTSETDTKRVERLKAELKTELLQEILVLGGGQLERPLGLLASVDLPPRFVEMLTDGWHEAGEYGTTVYVEWFSCFCTFFSHILDTNEHLRQLLENQVFNPSSPAVATLTLSAVQQQLLTFGEGFGLVLVEAFKQLYEHLEELRKDQGESLASIQTQLDRLLPQIALLPEIRKSENIRDLAQLVNSELMDRPAEKYRGSETANREKKLVGDLLSLFIGREDEFAQVNNFISNNASGILLVTARAGFGKTAFLLNWIDRSTDCFVAYHFFSTQYEATRSVIDGLTHLLQQIYAHYALGTKHLPTEEQALRDAIIGVLNDRLGQSDSKPLVIVIDGLDEAESNFSLPVPLPLPKGLFVIASARSSEGEHPRYLTGWTDDASKLPLPGLPLRDVVRWLQQAGSGELIELASDHYLIGKLYERTEGLPVFLAYLIPDLIEAVASGRDLQSLLIATPSNFESYVTTQFRLLAESEELRQAGEIKRLFTVLTVTKGPIDQRDLVSLVRLNSWDLASLPRQISRWVSIRRNETFTSYTFSHKLLADSFAKILSPEVPQIQDELVAYCSRWREHKSKYAFKHYPEHLSESKRWQELVALGKDIEFREAQSISVPHLAALRLGTTQLALRAAIQLDDVPSLASLMLIHLKLTEAMIPRETPVDLFHAGDLTAAWTSADYYGGQAPIFWRLLLILRILNSGGLKEAEELLGRLINQYVGETSQLWEGEFVKAVLANLNGINLDLHRKVSEKLLSHFHRKNLIVFLAKGDRQSLMLAQRLVDGLVGDNRHKAISEISKGLARAGEWETAIHGVDSIRDLFTHAWALADLAVIALEQQDREMAESLLGRLLNLKNTRVDWWPRRDRREVDIQWQIARTMAALAMHRDPSASSDKSTEYLATAENTIELIKQRSIKARALVDLASLYFSNAKPQAGHALLLRAKNMARGMRFPREAARLLTYIGRRYSDIGRQDLFLECINDALTLANCISELEPRIEVLKECAVDYAYEGMLPEAISVVYRIPMTARITEALESVAKVLVSRGQVESAYELADGSNAYKASKTGILTEIGLGLLHSGKIDEAENVLAKVLSEFRISVRKGINSHATSCLSYFARAYSISGNEERADALIDTISSRVSRIQNLEMRFWGLINTSKILGRELSSSKSSQLLQTAYAIAQVSKNRKKRSWLLSVVGQNLIKAGFNELGEQAFIEAEMIAEGLYDDSDKIQAYGTLAEALASVDQQRWASLLLNKALDLVESISLEHSQSRELARLSLQYAKSGLWERAEKLAGSPRAKRWKEARRAMSLVFVERGETNAALQEAEYIKNQRERAQAIRDMALIKIRKDEIEAALRVAERLISTEEGRSQLFRVARAMVEAGHRDGFLESLSLCIHSYGTVYEVIGLLALQNPSQAAQLELIFATEFGPVNGGMSEGIAVDGYPAGES